MNFINLNNILKSQINVFSSLLNNYIKFFKTIIIDKIALSYKINNLVFINKL